VSDSSVGATRAASRMGIVVHGRDADVNARPRWRVWAAGRPRVRLGGVARNMMIMGGGTALGQGALVLAAPVLSRLYDPQAFGLLSVYASVTAVLLAVASLRYDFAIPIAADPPDAIHLFALSVLLAFVASILLGLVILVWGAQLSAALGAALLTPLLWLLPIGLFVQSVAQALSAWATYHRAFPELGRWRTMQGLGQGACQVALGFLHAGPFGLIAGDVAGRAFGMQRPVRLLLAALHSIELSFATIRRCAHERWGFARVMAAASLLNALTGQVPFLLIPAYFGLESSGQYFLAYRVLVLPAALVGAAFSQVFFGEASFRRADPRRLHDLAHNAAVSLLVFSVPTYAIVAVGGSALIETVFGHQWMLAGLYAQIMAPSLILWSVSSPMSTLLIIGRRERESLAFTAAELTAKAGALGIGILVHSLTVGLVMLSMVTVLLSVSALWRFLRVASVSLRELVRPAGRIVASTVPSIGLVFLVARVAPAGVLPAMAVGWAIAFGLAARFSSEARAMLSGSHD
jgi:O-antigen/teichoic acid export membrane protein